MNKKVFLSITCMALLVFSISTVQATIILSIEPSAEKIHGVEQLDVDIVISGLVDDPATSPANENALGAFDLRLVYNPFVLDFTSIVFGDQLDILGLGSITDFAKDPNPSIGAVDFFEISLDSIFELETSQADSFTLATLSFIGLSSGFSSLNLAVPVLSDAWGNSISATVHSASVRVPEPMTLALLSLGLVGLCFSRRTLGPYKNV